MSKENQSEKIISDKLNSREFAFDEKAWAGMETLLDAQQKKRRFGFWWYFSASMFVVLVALGIWFLKPIADEKRPEECSSVPEEHSSTIAETSSMTERTSSTVAETSSMAERTSSTVAEHSSTIAETSSAVKGHSPMVAETSSTVKGHSSGTEEMTSTPAVNEKMIVTEGKTVASNETNTAADAFGLIEEQKIAEKEETISKNVSDSVKTAEQTPLTDSVALAETAKNPLTAPGKETKNVWGVLAGAGYWFPYQTTLGASTNEGRFGFTGGIYYRRILHKRWELGLSAIYSSRGALDFDKTFVNTNYGFGIESDKTTVSPKALHYLNIPFTIRFNATPRSHFFIGAAYYQLLATTSEVTRTIEDSFTSSEVSSEKQTGEHAGFRKNDVAAFIGYELTLFERINLGLQVSYGFYDITNDSYQKHDDIILKGFDRNISLQLQLKYDLIRH